MKIIKWTTRFQLRGTKTPTSYVPRPPWSASFGKSWIRPHIR